MNKKKNSRTTQRPLFCFVFIFFFNIPSGKCCNKSTKNSLPTTF